MSESDLSRGQLRLCLPFCLVLLMLSLLGCYDKLQPPVLVNGQDKAIMVECVISDGQQHTIEIQPKSAFWQRKEGLSCESIVVKTSAGDSVAEYTKAMLEEMRQATPGHAEIWLITEQGLELLDHVPKR